MHITIATFFSCNDNVTNLNNLFDYKIEIKKYTYLHK